METSTWIVQNDVGVEYLVEIMRFLIPEYVRIFGKDKMYGESCIVYNDTEAECPMLITNLVPVRIRLAQESLSYWTQTIFQLSHELCHYVIRQNKGIRDNTLSWFEEILCEAMSLYALRWAADNWANCALCARNPNYDISIKEYLNEQLNLNCSDGLAQCTSIEGLKNYIANENRISHRKERNYLYRAIEEDPLRCCCFCDYQKYIDENRITIDFDEWEQEDNNPLIRVLRSVQPCERKTA